MVLSVLILLLLKVFICCFCKLDLPFHIALVMAPWSFLTGSTICVNMATICVTNVVALLWLLLNQPIAVRLSLELSPNRAGKEPRWCFTSRP